MLPTGDLAKSSKYFSRALQIYQGTGDAASEVQCLKGLIVNALRGGKVDSAERCLERLDDLNRGEEHPFDTELLDSLANFIFFYDEYSDGQDEMQAYFDRCIDVYRRQGDAEGD